MTLLLEGRPLTGLDSLEEECFSQITHQAQRGGAWEAAEGSVLFLVFTKEESYWPEEAGGRQGVQIPGGHRTRLEPLVSATASVP